jgi:uncharacterized protein (TIGR04255 family)
LPNSGPSPPVGLWLPVLRRRPGGRRSDTVNNMATQKWMSLLKDRHYDNAPIKEAIIEIQIESSQPLALTNLEKAGISVPQGYAERRRLMMGQLRGQFEGGILTATANQDEIGYAFVGGEGKHVAQFRVNGFTFSRLAPYQTWVQLRNEAKTLWNLYRQIVGALPVVRVGLRYVNQLDIPMPIRDFRDFIRFYPEISSDLPQELAGFFLQVQIPQEDLGAMLILNEAMVPPPGPDFASVVLDIDVFKQGLKIESDDEVWNVLEGLRLRKNLIFEGCITNKTRELIS